MCQYTSFGIGSCSGLLVFQHLRLIELNEVNFLDVNETTVVARLLIGSPNPNTLKIKIDNDSSEYASDSEAPDLCFSDLGCEFSFKLEKLRNVILSYVTGSFLELKFMKFLLECSPVLETMSVDTSSRIDTVEKLKNLRAELLVGLERPQNRLHPKTPFQQKLEPLSSTGKDDDQLRAKAILSGGVNQTNFQFTVAGGNPSIWKKGNTDHHSDHDLLSDLPLSIIHIILAFIPIREAVRTCFLSRQWRYIWTSLPHLVFDHTSEEDESESKYEDFINRVLFRHKGPIHEFKVSCSPEFSNVEEWVFCLARNGIQKLTLNMNYDDDDVSNWLEMHSSLYLCKKLTYLELYRCNMDSPPLNFKGFLFLRCLSLNTVPLSRNEIGHLVSICPLLERFSLTQLEESELIITTPNLKYLDLNGDFEKLCIYAPLLTEISVELNEYNTAATHQQLKSSACDYAYCFGGFTDLQKLSGSSLFTKYLSFGIQFCHHSLVFHHLKFIDLECVNFEDVKEIVVVAHLVIGAPNLHKLRIRIDSYNFEHDASDAEDLHLSLRDLVCGSNFKLDKLSKVSLSYVTGSPLELKFMKFLLESSPVLEKMTLDISFEISTEEKQNLRAELLGCSWASPVVKLWMTDPDKPTKSLVLLHSEDDNKPVAEALS